MATTIRKIQHTFNYENIDTCVYVVYFNFTPAVEPGLVKFNQFNSDSIVLEYSWTFYKGNL